MVRAQRYIAKPFSLAVWGWVLSLLATSLLLAPVALAQFPLSPTEEATSPDGPRAPVPSVLAQFTTGIEDREPIDQISFVPSDVAKVFFFSDLRHMKGKTIRHRWVFQGQKMAEVGFEVRGSRWRVWSSKEMKPKLVGDWTVEVVDDSDEVIAAETFSYQSTSD